MDKIRILIVGDEEPSIMPLRGLLEDAGYEVHWVLGGEAALAKTKQAEFSLVILHSVRLDMDAPTLVRTIKQEASPRDVPIIICSGGDTEAPSFQRVYREVGVSEIFSKPYDVEKFLAVIREKLTPVPAAT